MVRIRYFAPKGIGYYKDSFIILNTGGLYRVGQDGKVVSKKLLNDFPQIKEEGYGIAVPDLTVYFSVYSFFGFDAAEWKSGFYPSTFMRKILRENIRRKC